MKTEIHPSSIIEDGAQIGDGCRIGPFCHVGPQVVLGDGAELKSHAVIAGKTTIGKNAKIFPFASIGHEPQDLKFEGEDCALIVGDDCIIREGVTMNPGTKGDENITTVGNSCVFLAYSHVAHDCRIGNNVIFSNSVMIAGHCKVGNNVIIGGMAGLENDVIPFGMALGNRAYLGGLNLVGMKRAGIERDSIHRVRNAFKDIFHSDSTVAESVAELDPELLNDPIVKKITAFITDSADRPLCTPK